MERHFGTRVKSAIGLAERRGVPALAVRLRIGVLPAGVALRHLIGLSLIAGIGFTVSLFVADLAFAGELLGEAKVAILAASVLAAAGGSILVRSTVPKSWD